MSTNGRRSFDDVRTTQPRHTKGCPRCGADRNAGQVGAIIGDLKATGTVGKRVASRNKSFCESCSVEVYELLVAVLLREAEVETVAA